MGMAASQARLLLLTSRIHDVELKAQQLQNAKLQLSTQQDEVYEEYQRALDATTLTFAISTNGVQSSIAATYDNLFSVNAANADNGSDFCLIDSRGRVVVSDDLYEAYSEYSGLENANAFAAWMLYGDGGPGAGAANIDLRQLAQIMSDVYNAHSDSDPRLDELYAAALGRQSSGGPSDYASQPGSVNDNPHSDVVTPHVTADSDSDGDPDPDPDPNPNPNPPPAPPVDPRNKIVRPTLGSISASMHLPNVKGGDNGGKGGDGGKGGYDAGKGGTGDNVNLRTTLGVNSLIGADTVSYAPPAPPSTPPVPEDNTPPVTMTRADQTGIMQILRGGTGVDGEAASRFLNYFFHLYGDLVFRNDDIPDTDQDRFDYYVRMYSAIQQHGGCISIDSFNGTSGPAASNSEWLTNMIQSGQLSIERFNIDNDGNVTSVGTSVSSEASLSYTATTRIDSAALAKAEADYEHALKVIDRKEKKIDLELNKIETERSALTKQYDSVKKVIDENVERTFGIFS